MPLTVSLRLLDVRTHVLSVEAHNTPAHLNWAHQVVGTCGGGHPTIGLLLSFLWDGTTTPGVWLRDVGGRSVPANMDRGLALQWEENK